jgi:rhamnose utilization protein RhaD (predicted bifunctional aldolase and dehydrogenase)
VPYVRPGAPLTRAILAAGGADADVLVLGNHGLVVGARDTEGAGRLVSEVQRRLHRAPRAAPPGDTARLRALSDGTNYAPADDPAVHGIATDDRSLTVARTGSLYPDHVIFLGPGIAVAETADDVAAAQHKLIAVPGAGVLLRKDSSTSELALARCLTDVVARLSPDEPIVALQPSDEQELLGWDAEKYRQAIARA